MTYYNEWDPYAAQWLKNLMAAGHISEGVVDDRSIKDVAGSDLARYTRAHFFAGIAGWDLALQLAGWPMGLPVWTASCPCQPFSAAGKRLGENDPRHLWPVLRDRVEECKPAILFGEQVAAKDGLTWLRGVRADLEALGYAFAASDLCAASVSAPHTRQRLFWVAYNDSQGFPVIQREQTQAAAHGGLESDPKAWWSAEPAVGRLADGLPGQVGRLRAYGNAIVPQVAAEFIAAFMEVHKC